MNAISKRLFSWLIVAAMVLSMVPALNLSNFAIETNAAAGDANYAGLSIDEHLAKNNIAQNDSDIQGHVTAGTCPMCGAEGITWTEVTSESAFPMSGNDKHLVVSGAISTPTKTFVNATGGKVCIALKSNANVNARKIYVESDSVVLNIMGTGKIYCDNSGGSESDPLSLLDIQKGTVNLYGGSYAHTLKGTKGQGTILMSTATAVCNIYAGVTIGPDEVDQSVATANVYQKNGVLNIYGGTIRNGVAALNQWSGSLASGNVNVVNGTCNMYGGTIENGTYKSDVTNSVGNLYVNGGTFNMYGGTIKDGKYNGNSAAGSIYGIGGAKINIYGGTVSGGQSTHASGRCGNIGGTNAAIKISGTAWIKDGQAKQRGGNIFIGDSNTTTVEITGGTISGGVAGNGGNIFAYTKSGNLIITGGEIYGGKADGGASTDGFGGNIYLYDSNSKMTVGGTALIYGGQANKGGNIYQTNSNTLTITGGTIVGDICGQSSTSKVILSGAPQIVKTYGTTTATSGLTLGGGARIDISGGLTAGANICMSNGVDTTITTSGQDATAVAGCFSHYDSDKIVELQSDKTLKIVEKPATPGSGAVDGEFDPEGNDGWAYCPACKAQGKTALVEWTAYTGDSSGLTAGGHYHLYLADNATQNANAFFLQKNGITVCFNLNGHTITATDGANATFYVKNKLFLMDSVGTGGVVANKDGNDTGAVVHINGGSECYIYGGTYTNDGTAPIVKLDSDGSNTLYLYDGAVIDGNNTARGIYLAGVDNIVNMEGGVIKNGMATDHGGNVWAFRGTFNMNGGTIQDGTAPNRGGNIYLPSGQNAVVNINGGKIFGGEAGYGGNIYAYSSHANANLTIAGGEIYKGTATNFGGNICLGEGESAKMTISGGKIYDGTAGEGANIYQYGSTTVDISGGTIVGDWFVRSSTSTVNLSGDPQILKELGDVSAVKYGMWLESTARVTIGDLDPNAKICVSVGAAQEISKAADNAADVKNCFIPYDDLYAVSVANNIVKLSVKDTAASIVTAEGTVYYADNQAAVDAYNGEGYILLGDGTAFELKDANMNYYIEGRGFSNIAVSGYGTLCATDWANDDFAGYGTWQVADTVTVANNVTHPVNGNRYIVIKQGNTYSAHRIQITMTHVTLRTGPKAGDYSDPGLYYKAEYKCDADLAGRISSFGAALELDEIPGADFAGENSAALYTELKDFADKQEDNTVSVTTCVLKNILSDDANNNAERIDMAVGAINYLKVNVQGDDDATNDVTFIDGGVDYSMLDVLKLINEKWTDYNTDQKNLVKNFYAAWADKLGVDVANQLPNIA